MKTINVAMAVFLGVLALTARLARAADEEELSVRVAVEQQEVFLDDSFVFQIQVSGNDEPEAPNLSGVKDFDVQSLGGQKNNSESVSIINGQMTRDVRRGYVFSYRLTPRRAGRLLIPSVEIRAGGRTVRTQPVEINAGKPQENEDFKLRVSVSRDKCYVNEPVTLTVILYFCRDVREVNFAIPILADKNFSFIDPESPMDPQKRYVRVPLGGATVIGETGQGVLDDKTYTTVRFQKVLFPKQPGTFSIPPATVACTALIGRATRDPFNRFFDDDFFRSRGSYKKFVTPSNALTLHVADVPAQDRPANFSGLVGNYRIEAAAVPTHVNVGDPITLTVKIKGSEYLKQVELPPLERQAALARDFKIPSDMAPGKVEGDAKVFTQTLRALHSDVKQIPPIELSYFDTKIGKYQTARTKAIPLVVKETKVLTARDAEGRDLVPVQTELRAWHEGIAHNYEDLGVLENQEFGPAALVHSPFWLALEITPPLTYGLLLAAMTVLRVRRADPAAARAKRAHRELIRRVKICLANHPMEDSEAFGELLEAARNYLGSKLRMAAGSLTWGDAESRLRPLGLSPEVLRGLKQVFEDCEAGRYAGAGGPGEGLPAAAQRLLDAARRLERSLK